MKRMLVMAICLCSALISIARESEESRDFKLSVRNRKGKVIKNFDLIAFLSRDSEPILLDKSGNSYLEASDLDTLNILIGSNIYEFSLADTDSLCFEFKNRRRQNRAAKELPELNLGSGIYVQFPKN